MAGEERRILLDDVDPMALIDELAARAVTDGHGLTLGDLAGHRLARYATLHRTLHLLGGVARLGWLRHTDTIKPIGAAVQDKQAMDVFEAAHLLPCDLDVNGREGVGRLFSSPIIRGNVEHSLFGRTRVVHRLVNYADRRCEANGWIAAFVRAVRSLAQGADAEAVFTLQVVPAYAQAVAAARDRLVSALQAAEKRALGQTALLAPNGQPARLREQDFRVSRRNPDPRVRALNKQAVLQVFAEYIHGPAGLSPEVFARSRQQAADWVELERQWRARYGRRADT